MLIGKTPLAWGDQSDWYLNRPRSPCHRVVYATRGLIASLLRQAADREPDSVTIPLAVTAAGDLDESALPAGLARETPVFTHFYMPDAGGAVNAVFGVDLGTPAGQTQGRFVSHPDGRLALQETDDFHALIFVAVPPWDLDSIAVFDRHGVRQGLEILDVEPPEEFPDL